MPEPALNLVLFQPKIPNNTGNIGRTAVATGSRLHLIHPLGFSLDEKALRRAGLDYWAHLDLCEHASFAEYLRSAAPERLWLFTTGSGQSFRTAQFGRGDHLLFGPEDSGVPESIQMEVAERYGPEHLLRIPMVDLPAARSLNLATAVAIGAYEALRGFDPS